MVIEILTEDKSGSVTVERLVRRICKKFYENKASANASKNQEDKPSNMPTINVRPHRGCGNLPHDWDNKPPRFASGLLDLLPAKCRAYEECYGNEEVIFVVVMDSDDNDPVELRKTLYTVCKKYAPNVRSVIGLCVEEVESWLLGDHEAISKAYPEADISAISLYEQDSVCGTWEALCRVVCPDNYEDVLEIGYPAIGQYKAKWSEVISKYLDPEKNVSPSFILFKHALEAALTNPKPISSNQQAFLSHEAHDSKPNPKVRRITF